MRLFTFLLLFATSTLGFQLSAQGILPKQKKSAWNQPQRTNSPHGGRTVIFLLESFQQPYADLQNAISLTDNEVWDDPEIALEMPISFKLADDPIDVMDFSIDVGAVVGLYNASPSIIHAIAPIYFDAIDRGSLDGQSISSINASLEGTEGSRIFKLEWNNVGSYPEITFENTNNMFVNQQLWFYEADNSFEFRYGPSQISNPDIFFEADLYSSGYVQLDLEVEPLLFNLLDDSQVSIFISDNEDATISSYPENGQVYRFIPIGSTSTVDVGQISFSMYPNPSSEELNIAVTSELREERYEIFQLNGRKVKEGFLSDGEAKIRLTDMEAGAYLLKIGSVSKKFVVMK